jgi:hypothetical protein
MEASAAGYPLFEVAKTWIVYVGVFATAIIVAFGGIRKALKDIGAADKTATDSPTVHRTIGGTILENTTILLWSESNRSVTEALEAVVSKLESTVHAINYNTDAVREMCEDLTELRHQIERLRDKMT